MSDEGFVFDEGRCPSANSKEYEYLQQPLTLFADATDEWPCYTGIQHLYFLFLILWNQSIEGGITVKCQVPNKHVFSIYILLEPGKTLYIGVLGYVMTL